MNAETETEVYYSKRLDGALHLRGVPGDVKEINPAMPCEV